MKIEKIISKCCLRIFPWLIIACGILGGLSVLREEWCKIIMLTNLGGLLFYIIWQEIILQE